MMKTVTFHEYRSKELVECTAISVLEHDSQAGYASIYIGDCAEERWETHLMESGHIHLLEHTSQVIEACARAGWPMPNVICFGGYCPGGKSNEEMPKQMWEPYYAAAAGGDD